MQKIHNRPGPDKKPLKHYSMKIKPPADKPSGFLFTSLGMISKDSDDIISRAAAIQMEKFHKDVKRMKIILYRYSRLNNGV